MRQRLKDFDSLLFGSPRLCEESCNQWPEEAPAQDVYVDVQPEEISLEATLSGLGITREQLATWPC